MFLAVCFTAQYLSLCVPTQTIAICKMHASTKGLPDHEVFIWLIYFIFVCCPGLSLLIGIYMYIWVIYYSFIFWIAVSDLYNFLKEKMDVCMFVLNPTTNFGHMFTWYMYMYVNCAKICKCVYQQWWWMLNGTYQNLPIDYRVLPTANEHQYVGNINNGIHINIVILQFSHSLQAFCLPPPK